MSGPPRVIVHIGTDQAGGASFESWARANADELADRLGLRVYEGWLGADHVELPMLAMRDDRSFEGRVAHYDWCLDQWQAEARRHIAEQVTKPAEVLLVSAPALSLLRHVDEIERLRDLLGPRQVSVVVAVRAPKPYLRARAAELGRMRIAPSRYRQSFAYVEDGSWVTDRDALLEPYRAVFGADAVHVVDYEAALARSGSVVPALLAPFGYRADDLPAWPRDPEASATARLAVTPRDGLLTSRARYVAQHPVASARVAVKRLRRTSPPSGGVGDDRPRGRAIVHIGTHKTGSTSFQDWAGRNSRSLDRDLDLRFFDGRFGGNHIEFPILAMRPNRGSNHRVVEYDWCLDEWQADVRALIRQQAASPAETLLVSAEALDFLRHPDEVEQLRDLLHPREVSVVVVLRDRQAFLRSYAAELAKGGNPPSRFRESWAYVEPDSWLIDYESLLAPYRAVLGADHVQVVDYEASLARLGSVIPAILEPFGYAPDTLPDWNATWKNATPESGDEPGVSGSASDPAGSRRARRGRRSDPRPG